MNSPSCSAIPAPPVEELALRGEALHAVVVELGDQERAVGVEPDPERSVQLPRFGAVVAPLGEEPPVGVEDLHGAGLRVGGNDVAIGVEDVDPTLPVHDQVDRGDELPGLPSFAAPGGQEAPVRAELLDAVVAGVGDVEGAVRGEGDRRLVVAAPADVVKSNSPSPEPEVPHTSRKAAVRGEDLEPVVVAVRHPDGPVRGDGEVGGVPERVAGSPRVSHRNSTGPAGGVASWARARPSRLPRLSAAVTTTARPRRCDG